MTAARDARSCPVCATPVPGANAFCGACGARLPASESTATEDALIGRVVDGRFRILRLLGAGGMGAVYLAEHVGIGKRVALKVVRADLRNNPDLVRRFRREAMAVSKLTDLHTITVFDFGIWKGLIYLVMEYLRGEDLADVLGSDQRLPPMRALRIAHQICSSLAEAHAVGVVHRDLKPENIFLSTTTSGDELVKVLDFGLAKLLEPIDGDGRFETQDGTLMGTPFFMAPEIIRGDDVDGRADIYALGALLYRMLTGRNPHAGKRALDVLQAHLNDPLVPISAVAPEVGISDEIEALVGRMLAKDRDERPTTAMAVDDEIHSALVGPLSPSRPEPSITTARPRAMTPPVNPSADTFDMGDLPDWDSVPLDPRWEPPTRDEFAAYERRLKWASRVRVFGLVLLVGAAAGAGWLAYTQRGTPPATEQEPNDEPRQASSIAVGGHVDGYIGARSDPTRSDRDVYRVSASAQDRLRIAVTAVPAMDLVIEVFDAGSERVEQINKAPAGLGETFDLTVPSDPIYLVVREVWVQGERPTENSTNAYRLSVERIE